MLGEVATQGVGAGGRCLPLSTQVCKNKNKQSLTDKI